MGPFAVEIVVVGVAVEGFAGKIPAVDWMQGGRDEGPVVKEGPLLTLDQEEAVAVSALRERTDRETEMIEASQLLYQELYHHCETVQQQMGLELLGHQVLGSR